MGELLLGNEDFVRYRGEKDGSKRGLLAEDINCYP